MKELKKYPKEFSKWLTKKLSTLYKEFKTEQKNVDYKSIIESYHIKIHAIRQKDDKFRISDAAKKKIQARLKEFSEKELLQAIENFSNNEWRMENNSNKGLTRFFYNEDRIEQFLNLQTKSDKSIQKMKDFLKK